MSSATQERDRVALLAASRPQKALELANAFFCACDILLLGMGPDGHVLSVFPGSAALSPEAPLVVAIPAPTHIKPELPRVTLHPAVIGAARSVLLIVGGAAKATVVVDVLEEDPAIETYPARLARIDTATWLLDPSCAGGLVLR